MAYTDTWTPARVAHLKKRWAEGASGGVIALEIGLDHLKEGGRNAVIGKVHRLGLASRATVTKLDQTPRNERAWSDEEVALLRSLWSRGFTGGQISRRMPGRSRSAVVKRAWMLGLKRCAAGPYNPATQAKPAWLQEYAHARS